MVSFFCSLFCDTEYLIAILSIHIWANFVPVLWISCILTNSRRHYTSPCPHLLDTVFHCTTKAAAEGRPWHCTSSLSTTGNDFINIRIDSRLAPSQWETALLCTDVSHWLGANLESALNIILHTAKHLSSTSSYIQLYTKTHLRFQLTVLDLNC